MGRGMGFCMRGGSILGEGVGCGAARVWMEWLLTR